MKEEGIGHIDGVGDVALAGIDSLPGVSDLEADDSGLRISAEGNALWNYHNLGRINGVPVADDARSLPVDRDDMLAVAFTLDRRPRSLMLYMKPDDPESFRAYDDIMDAVYDGRAEIIDEIRQYDAASSRFVVWIRYNELKYVLNERFAYLREE